MPFGTTAALITAGALSAGSSVAGGIMGSNAASNAANAQAQASEYAANLQKQEADNALAFQKQQYDTSQKEFQPWLQAGTGGINQLSQLLGIGPNNGTADYGSLSQPWTSTFQAPTGATEQNDPGYQFRLDQGMKALQNSAAARGGLLTSGTAKDINNYAQDYASNEYNNVYGRALNQYELGYNTFQQNQANQFNRLAALSGIGQTAAGTLGQLGQNASTNTANIMLGSGSTIGNDIMAAGAARGSGYVGGANALNGALTGAGNNISQLAMLYSLLNNNPSSVNLNSMIPDATAIVP